MGPNRMIVTGLQKEGVSSQRIWRQNQQYIVYRATEIISTLVCFQKIAASAEQNLKMEK